MKTWEIVLVTRDDESIGPTFRKLTIQAKTKAEANRICRSFEAPHNRTWARPDLTREMKGT